MGKKCKKTRWRTLTLNGHQSDSEESSSKSSLQTSKNYQHKYSKFPYSSQSTPIRKFQHDSSKSTRSNSTTSEHKATFNEDEYTRITTPRQDVLFKKGYLSKPKSYQTQTSTGTSSTANSTSTCTPDHQSADGTEGTDLEYESQFVFPNGFIDQNGIYYINSFEPFPFVVYNAPICYSEYPNSRSKRYSTDSLTESMSPHNEESSQELSQNGVGERINNTPVFNQSYLPPASYYYNGVCTSANGQYVTEEPRKLKKKRRRKVSRSRSNQEDDATSEGSDEDDSSDEVFSQTQDSIEHKTFPKSSHQPSEDEEARASPKTEETPVVNGIKEIETTETEVNGVQEPESLPTTLEEVDEPTEREEPEENQSTKSNISDAQNMLLQSLLKNSEKDESEDPEAQESESHTVESSESSDASNSKYSLKPDAEEFIPRTFRAPEAIPFDPNVQFLNLQPNFIPIPFVNHLGELQRPPFLPPGIPLNFVQDPKLLPNFVNIVPNGFMPKNYNGYPEAEAEAETHNETEPDEKEVEEEVKQDKPEASSQTETEVVPVKKPQTKNEIDIAKIVSKLEEAAKQQRFYENKRQGYGRPSSRYNSSRPYTTQRGRFNRYHQDNRYQRSRPNSLDEERNYRKPEGYQREPRSRPNYERASSADNKRTQAQVNESVQTTHAQNEPHQAGDHHPVNNVNSRISESCSIGKDLKLESTVNYSESLKKHAETKAGNNMKCARYEKHEKTQKKIVSPVVAPKPQRAPNQWIPVSRKKRKNKGGEEQNVLDLEEPEDEPVQNDDLFESFDVNQLVDVVPPSQLTDEDAKHAEENPVENTENLVTNAEGVTKDISEPPALEIQPLIPVEDASMEESAKSIEPPAKVEEESPMLLTKETTTAVKSGKKKQNEQKKKSKKGTQKPLTRRVMINDVDLELNKPTPKEETGAKTEVVVETIEAKPNAEVEQPSVSSEQTAAPVEQAVSEDLVNETPKPNEGVHSSPTSQTQTSESDALAETPEKKSKKKKKKVAKPTLVKIQSVSSSNTTLSNLDDSYDFLLENSVLEDFELKTNVEISQELDRMIQKGMYSSLEEKIRSLRINATDDGFFKTINYGVFHTHADVEKPNSIKASNFGEMLKNTTQLLKPPRINEEIDNQSLINIDFSKIKLPDLEPQPSTSKSGIFLENPLVNELIKNTVEPSLTNDPQQPSSKTKNNGKLKNKSKKEKSKKPNATGEATIELESKNLTTSKTFSYHDDEPTSDDPMRKTPPKQDSLYPITQAVKEWMTKTRENTPDIEILKSPNTIYKEFYASETENSKNGVGDPRPAKSLSRETSPLSKGGARAAELTNDDEITIWSASPQNSVDEDLLDCWENELTNGCKPESEGNVNPKPVLIPNGDIKEVKGSVHNGGALLNGHIEEGEEAIEIYESKYGKNEDFLRLKAEIDEQQKNLNFPRHGNLPYRAICCSIM